MNKVMSWDCIGDKEIVAMSEFLKATSDVTRLKIIRLLFRGENCVCDIERELGISQPLVSHHL